MTAEELVKQIAEENPITAQGEINECKFCGTSWAEENFDKYLHHANEMHEIRAAADTEQKRVQVASKLWNLTHTHHDSDCLWIEANRIVRITNA